MKFSTGSAKNKSLQWWNYFFVDVYLSCDKMDQKKANKIWSCLQQFSFKSLFLNMKNFSYICIRNKINKHRQFMFYARLVLRQIQLFWLRKKVDQVFVLYPLISSFLMSRRSQSFRQGPLHTSKRSQSQNAVNTSISAHPLLPIETGLYYFYLSFFKTFILLFFSSFFRFLILWFLSANKKCKKNLNLKISSFKQRNGKLANRASNRRCLLRWRRKRIWRVANPKLLPNTAVLRSRQHRWRLIRWRRHRSTFVATANNWIRVSLPLQRRLLSNAAPTTMRTKSVGLMCFPTIAT